MVYTVIYCTGIALVLYLLGLAEPFTEGWGVSLSIGLSIHISFLLLEGRLQRLLPPYVGAGLLTALGLLVGLVISGALLFGSPWFFLTGNWYTLLLGVFFGLLGITFMGTRTRLSDTQAELDRARAEREAQERLLLSTELKLLQAQIEPHFLFNTLSNAIGLIHRDPDTAEKLLLDFSTLLRASLQRTRQKSATLAQEWELLRAYLDIQSTRMEGRLQYSLDPEKLEEQPTLARCILPPLLLQPLVENAIQHGIEPLAEGGEVTVTAQCKGDSVVLTVRDNGKGLDSHAPSSGTGIRNIEERLRGLYGDRATLSLQPGVASGVIAQLTLPMSEAN